MSKFPTYKAPPPPHTPTLGAVQIPYLLQENQDLLQAFSIWTTLRARDIIVIVTEARTVTSFELGWCLALGHVGGCHMCCQGLSLKPPIRICSFLSRELI